MKEIIKKEYASPAIDVVEMEIEDSILSASGATEGNATTNTMGVVHL